MKIIVYSVNIGGYDGFREPTIVDPNIRYILFTDNKNYKSKIWEVNHIDFVNKKLDNRRKSRFIKINPHLVLPPHDINVWLDHCYIPRFPNAQKMLSEIGFKGGVMCYKHNERKCIYDESVVVIKNKLDHTDLVKKQMEQYINEGFPKNYGLFDSGFTIRKNDGGVIKFNDVWWQQINSFSARDQLSQVYSSWKTDIRIYPILVGSSIYNNKFLNPKIPHPKRWVV